MPKSSPVVTCSTTARDPCRPGKFRDDVHTIGVPLTEIANLAYTDPRQRQLFKNIIYVGALSVLLDVEAEVFDKLFAEQYKGKGKERLLEFNVQALHLGRDYVKQHMQAPLGIRVQRSDNVGDQIFTDGNSAAALGLVYGGATVAAWYPITPSTSIPEAFQKYCEKFRVDPATGQNRFAIVQAEDELASIGMVVGAGWNGARAFTATSGPGVSLMTEFIGLAYFAEIPVTIINVQRGGPSTGMPTRTQQSDLLSCAYASHGDTKHVLLFPQDPHECFTHSAAALDLAERLQTPIFVMTDLDIGMNQRLCKPFAWDDAQGIRPRQSDDCRRAGSRQELSAVTRTWTAMEFRGARCPARIPARGLSLPGAPSRNPQAMYSEHGPDYIYNMERLLRKFKTAADLVPQPVFRKAAEATDLGVIYYGSTSPPCARRWTCWSRKACMWMRMRLCAFPFPESVRRFHCRARQGVCGGAKPRRADALHADQ